jgi:hypothetical protein
MNRKIIFTLADAVDERHHQDALQEARWAAREAIENARFERRHKAFMATPTGKSIAQAHALRWCPPQYRGGAAEWYLNNASPSTTPAAYAHVWA